MNLGNIPQELKQLNQWVIWGVDKAKPKIPYSPVTMLPAKAGQPATWGSFEEAAQRVAKGEAQGVGFEFNNNGYYGIDLDKVISVNGQLASEAQTTVSMLDSYTECSPSGSGLHIIVMANKVTLTSNRKGFIEVYTQGRYFTFTGDIYGDRKPIQERTEELQQIYNQFLKPAQPTVQMPTRQAFFSQDSLTIGLKKDQKLISLWNGNISSYNSQSEADLALINKLAYWCNGDEGHILQAFMSSPHYAQKDIMHKKKCDRKDYLPATIQKALQELTKTAQEDNESWQRQHTLDMQIKSVKPDDFTDTGNARVFAREFEVRAIYVKSVDWLVWNGKVWEEGELEAAGLAMKLTDKMLAEAKTKVKSAGDAITAANVSEDDEAKQKAKQQAVFAAQYRKHANSTRSQPKIAAMLKLARTLLQVKPDKLDSDPCLLNTPAGIVDLKTGIISPHNPTKFCTKMTKCSPGNKGSQMWKAFLNTVTQNDDEMAAFLQQVAGMAAVGKVFEESLIIAIGDGKNGKSALFNALAIVFNDYAGTIAAEILTTANRSKGAELATLKGKRLIIAAETEEGARLSASMLKQITSTDKIHAERKYKDPEDFMPSHTTILYTNHLLRIGSTDSGTWRRLILLPFDAKIETTKEVKNYADVLAREAGEAILSWVIEGAVNFCKMGHKVSMPNTVENAIKKYQIKNDWMAEFLAECCEVGKGNNVKGKPIYSAYRDWAIEGGGYARHKGDFTEELEKRGFEQRRSNAGAQWYGLDLSNSTKAENPHRYA